MFIFLISFSNKKPLRLSFDPSNPNDLKALQPLKMKENSVRLHSMDIKSQEVGKHAIYTENGTVKSVNGRCYSTTPANLELKEYNILSQKRAFHPSCINSSSNAASKHHILPKLNTPPKYTILH